MPNMYLERLMTQREQTRADAQSVLEQAAAENRDVNDAERQSVEAMFREVEEIDKQIEPMHKAELRQVAHDQQVAELDRALRSRRAADVGNPNGGAAPTDGSGQLAAYRSVGYWLADWGAKMSNPAAAQRIYRAQAEYRVVADQLIADNPGIVPEPIVGPLISELTEVRPFIDSVTPRPMPARGKQFSRPRITQHSQVGEQTVEKSQLASRKLVIGGIDVTKKTWGGTLDISFQDRDWTEPAILDIAISDLQGVYADQTDNAGADAFVAQTTSTAVLAPGASAEVVTQALLDAAAQIFAATTPKTMPDTLWLSADMWARWAGLTNAQGVKAFPGMASVSAPMGGTPLGARTVVDGNFAAGTAVLGISRFVEHYEQRGGLLSVTEPTILGYTIAWYGYNADVVLDPVAFRRFTAT